MGRHRGYPNGFKRHGEVPAKFPKPTMTRAQNGLQYRMWLFSATDDALRAADPETMAKRAGISADEVRADIARQLSA